MISGRHASIALISQITIIVIAAPF